MSDNDPIAQAREHLLQKVKEVATAPASLDALYTLEGSIEYSHLWYDAREQLRAAVERTETETAWSFELRRSPPDTKLWLPFVYRRETTAFAMQKSMAEWEAKGLDGFFTPHHHIPGITEGAAAVHITLLSDIDPVAAVEYAAALPSAYLVWPAAHRLQISERPDLVDRVLRESSQEKAVMLSLACELDAARMLVDNLARSKDEGNVEMTNDAWDVKIPSRLRTVGRLLLARADAGTVIGVWMRHLLRVATHETKDRELDAGSRIAMTGLDQLLAEVKASHSAPQLPVTSARDAADLVARMLLAQEGDGVSLWEGWCELARAEHRTLDPNNTVYWGAAADALRRHADPYATWMNSMRTLEPLLRTRARGIEGDADPVVHMVMPAANAAAAMGEHGGQLWWALYERARRHFFVDAPRDDEYGYGLCSAVFGAFPKVFGDRDDRLASALQLLPTQKHVEWARAYVAANSTISDAEV